MSVDATHGRNEVKQPVPIASNISLFSVDLALYLPGAVLAVYGATPPRADTMGDAVMRHHTPERYMCP